MENDFPNYISLRQASKLCEHSQDYLNLLVRKRRLRAVKIGRNWVTTEEWLQNYLRRVEEKKTKGTKLLITTQPPKFGVDVVLPVPITAPAIVGATAKKDSPKIFANLRPAGILVSSLILLFIVAVIAFNFLPNRYFFANNVKTPSLEVARADASGNGVLSLVENVDAFIKSKIFAFGDYLFKGKTEIVEVSEPAVDRVVLQKSIDALETNITDDTKNRFDNFRQQFDSSDMAPAALSSAQQGVVVVPVTGDVAATEEKIKESFSDKVAVKPVDDTSGIIVPQFKDKQGEDYMYMMVPVKNN